MWPKPAQPNYAGIRVCARDAIILSAVPKYINGNWCFSALSLIFAVTYDKAPTLLSRWLRNCSCRHHHIDQREEDAHHIYNYAPHIGILLCTA
jgi:hypothetical protein